MSTICTRDIIEKDWANYSDQEYVGPYVEDKTAMKKEDLLEKET
jgi:hypothetical protein